jgi:hypothetical protein
MQELQELHLPQRQLPQPDKSAPHIRDNEDLQVSNIPLLDGLPETRMKTHILVPGMYFKSNYVFTSTRIMVRVIIGSFISHWNSQGHE